MKKIIFIQLFVCFVSISLAQNNPRAYFDVAQFQTVDKKPYVEAYLNLVGNSLKWIKTNNSFHATVEIEYLFYVDTLLKKVSKVNLSSPEVYDTTMKINFLDVQRFSLNDGTYKLIINIKDASGNGKKSTIVANLILHASESLPTSSDIEFVETMKASTDNKNVLFKSGFEIMPYISTFLDANQNDFIFYSELYNAPIYMNKNQLPSKSILSYGIYKDGIVMDGYIKQQRIEAQQINVVLGKFNISDLLTGKYELKIKLQDANGKVFIEKSKYFDRISNKSSLVLKKDSTLNSITFPYNISSKDSLKEMLLSIQPIASNTDFNISMAVLKDYDIKKMQNFLYNFWNTRKPGNPEFAYYQYAEQVYNAQVLFGSVKRKGYLTDRGRVFLQYGAPNSRNPIYNDADNYPYEIWQYYRINDVAGKPESNRMFVFADFNLTDIDFKLIHSTARGETNDIRWQIRLKKRTIQPSNLDETQPLNTNGNADDFFNTPR